jgi:hypothetical protein
MLAQSPGIPAKKDRTGANLGSYIIFHDPCGVTWGKLGLHVTVNRRSSYFESRNSAIYANTALALRACRLSGYLAVEFACDARGSTTESFAFLEIPGLPRIIADSLPLSGKEPASMLGCRSFGQ